MACAYHPIQVFVDLVREMAKPGMNVAEVGCFDGSTSVHYLPIIQENNGKAFLIDWFKGEESVGERNSQQPHGYSDDSESVYQSLLENITQFTTCVVLKGKSKEMAEFIADESLDICFIDADHKYDAVKSDIELYYPKVKIGGILCGHDCDGWEWRGQFTPDQVVKHYINMTHNQWCHPGVVQAVYEAFGDMVTIRQDTGSHNIPIWIRVKPVLLLQ